MVNKDFHMTSLVMDAMYETYHSYTPKATNTSELKNVLQAIWAKLPQAPINAAILSFFKRFQAYYCSG